MSTFELQSLPNYCELFNNLWLTYVKLIIGVNQNLLMVTKCGVYRCPSFNFACTTSIVKSLKRQTFCKLINFESTHTHYTKSYKHASNHANMGACLKNVIGALPRRSVKNYIKEKIDMFSSFKDSTFMTHIHACNRANKKCIIRKFGIFFWVLRTLLSWYTYM